MTSDTPYTGDQEVSKTELQREERGEAKEPEGDEHVGTGGGEAGNMEIDLSHTWMK